MFSTLSFSSANSAESDTTERIENDSAFKDIKEILLLVSDYVKKKNLGVLDITHDVIEKVNDKIFWYPWPDHIGWSIFYWGDSAKALNSYPPRSRSRTERLIYLKKKRNRFIIIDDKCHF